jgi:hypothetical protein
MVASRGGATLRLSATAVHAWTGLAQRIRGRYGSAACDRRAVLQNLRHSRDRAASCPCFPQARFLAESTIGRRPSRIRSVFRPLIVIGPTSGSDMCTASGQAGTDPVEPAPTSLSAPPLSTQAMAAGPCQRVCESPLRAGPIGPPGSEYDSPGSASRADIRFMTPSPTAGLWASDLHVRPWAQHPAGPEPSGSRAGPRSTACAVPSRPGPGESPALRHEDPSRQPSTRSGGPPGDVGRDSDIVGVCCCIVPQSQHRCRLSPALGAGAHTAGPCSRGLKLSKPMAVRLMLLYWPPSGPR